jgi:hypothetical protein
MPPSVCRRLESDRQEIRWSEQDHLRFVLSSSSSQPFPHVRLIDHSVSSMGTGLMNEPHDISLQPWVAACQAAVTAIRGAGATSQYILLPGNGWTHAQEMIVGLVHSPLVFSRRSPADLTFPFCSLEHVRSRSSSRQGHRQPARLRHSPVPRLRRIRYSDHLHH